MTDVSITCGDVSLEAHSLILSASSPILRSILAKGEGKKQTLHFMDMNPYHMQLLLQYMYKGEISVPQAELATLMASARSLQIKGLCNTTSPAAAPMTAQPPLPPTVPPTISVPNTLPGNPPTIAIAASQPDQPQVTVESNRLSEFANYLAAQTQPLPPTAISVSAASSAVPLDLHQQTHLLEVEPPQQPIVTAAASKKRRSQVSTSVPGGAMKKKRKSKKPFEDLRNGELQHTTASVSVSAPGNFVAVPDSSNSNGNNACGSGANVTLSNHVGDVQDDDHHVTGNASDVINNGEAATSGGATTSGATTENWSDQQTMKVKV